MDKFSKKIRELSDSRVKKLGLTPIAVGWKSKEQQELRFKILIKHLDLHKNASLLDLGCGFSDLYAYLTKDKIKRGEIFYTGVDISMSMLEKSRNLYPEIELVNVDFWTAETDFFKSFDFIICSGALNYSFSDYKISLLEKFLDIYWSKTKKALALNLITTDVDFMDSKLNYHDPSITLSVVRRYTKKYVLDSNYPLWEYTVILYK